jgi:hypothetical protein
VPTPLAYPLSTFIELPQEASAKKTYLDSSSGLICQRLSNLDELTKTLDIYDRMQPYWPLPKILSIDYGNLSLIMQDGGRKSLGSQGSREYQWAYLLLKQGEEVVLPGTFDSTRVEFEFSLYVEWFLSKYLGVQHDPYSQRFLEKFLVWIKDVPKVATHLDFHSANILYDDQSDRISFIDYQDALMGPYLYDGLCLLEDAYVDVSSHTRRHLVRMIIAHACRLNRSFIDDYLICAQQRLMKVLGIFCRLSLRDGKWRYLSYLGRCLTRLKNLSQGEEKTYFSHLLELMNLKSHQDFLSPF